MQLGVTSLPPTAGLIGGLPRAGRQAERNAAQAEASAASLQETAVAARLSQESVASF